MPAVSGARDGSTRGRGMGGQGVGDRAANPPPPGCTSRPCVDAGYCPDPGPLTGNVRGRRCAAPRPQGIPYHTIPRALWAAARSTAHTFPSGPRGRVLCCSGPAERPTAKPRGGHEGPKVPDPPPSDPLPMRGWREFRTTETMGPKQHRMSGVPHRRQAAGARGHERSLRDLLADTLAEFS